MCDLNQKTMQAFGNLAVVYATFEVAGANLQIENSEGDTLYPDECEAKDDVAKAQQHQDRLQEELKISREKLDTAFIQHNNHRGLVPWFGGCGQEVHRIEAGGGRCPRQDQIPQRSRLHRVYRLSGPLRGSETQKKSIYWDPLHFELHFFPGKNARVLF